MAFVPRKAQDDLGIDFENVRGYDFDYIGVTGSLNREELRLLEETLHDMKIHAHGICRVFAAKGGQWHRTNLIGGAAITTEVNQKGCLVHSIKVIDLKAWNPSYSLVVNQEMYYGMEYLAPLPTFHTFEMDRFVVGIQFADLKEGRIFFTKAKALLATVKPLDETIKDEEFYKKMELSAEARERIRAEEHRRDAGKAAAGALPDFLQQSISKAQAEAAAAKERRDNRHLPPEVQAALHQLKEKKSQNIKPSVARKSFGKSDFQKIGHDPHASRAAPPPVAPRQSTAGTYSSSGGSLAPRQSAGGSLAPRQSAAQGSYSPSSGRAAPPPPPRSTQSISGSKSPRGYS